VFPKDTISPLLDITPILDNQQTDHFYDQFSGFYDDLDDLQDTFIDTLPSIFGDNQYNNDIFNYPSIDNEIFKDDILKQEKDFKSFDAGFNSKEKPPLANDVAGKKDSIGVKNDDYDYIYDLVKNMFSTEDKTDNTVAQMGPALSLDSDISSTTMESSVDLTTVLSIDETTTPRLDADTTIKMQDMDMTTVEPEVYTKDIETDETIFSKDTTQFSSSIDTMDVTNPNQEIESNTFQELDETTTNAEVNEVLDVRDIETTEVVTEFTTQEENTEEDTTASVTKPNQTGKMRNESANKDDGMVNDEESKIEENKNIWAENDVTNEEANILGENKTIWAEKDVTEDDESTPGESTIVWTDKDVTDEGENKIGEEEIILTEKDVIDEGENIIGEDEIIWTEKDVTDEGKNIIEEDEIVWTEKDVTQDALADYESTYGDIETSTLIGVTNDEIAKKRNKETEEDAVTTMSTGGFSNKDEILDKTENDMTVKIEIIDSNEVDEDKIMSISTAFEDTTLNPINKIDDVFYIPEEAPFIDQVDYTPATTIPSNTFTTLDKGISTKDTILTISSRGLEDFTTFESIPAEEQDDTKISNGIEINDNMDKDLSIATTVSTLSEFDMTAINENSMDTTATANEDDNTIFTTIQPANSVVPENPTSLVDIKDIVETKINETIVDLFNALDNKIVDITERPCNSSRPTMHIDPKSIDIDSIKNVIEDTIKDKSASDKVIENDKVISTNEGKVRGKVFEATDGFRYTKYPGIPYAEPPVGNLRFKRPRRKESWKGTFNSKEGIKCMQTSFKYPVEGDEDCLYLNVWVPETDLEEPLPVMVWLHEGSFCYGSGDDLEHNFNELLKQNVIVVSMNYRLGAFGFFTLGNYQFSGNLGIRDQRLSLSWVYRNIRNFGGNPSQVTLFGHGAGAVSAQMHLISRGSRGLFSGVILQSGSLLTKPDFGNTTLDVIRSSNKLAELFDCGQDVEECLQSQHAVDLALMSLSINMSIDKKNHLVSSGDSTWYWQPILDKEFSADPLLNKSPLEYLLEGKSNYFSIFVFIFSLEENICISTFILFTLHLNYKYLF
jgi:hypothetical protein